VNVYSQSLMLEAIEDTHSHERNCLIGTQS
jgi:hypothetical protein